MGANDPPQPVQHEVDRYFDSVSRYWDDVYMDPGLQGEIYRRRQERVLALLDGAGLPEGASVLEVGCAPSRRSRRPRALAGLSVGRRAEGRPPQQRRPAAGALRAGPDRWPSGRVQGALRVRRGASGSRDVRQDGCWLIDRPQLGVSQELVFRSTGSAGWYDLSFAAPVSLASGSYWIGVITGASSGVAQFRYDGVAGSRVYNANAYGAGPSNPFGAVGPDGEQTSLYATYAAG